MKAVFQWLLYHFDPVFREWVDRKKGPNDKVHTGETIKAILSRDDKIIRIVKGGK